MQALAFALGATLLWSFTNLLDKGLVQRYGADGSLGALIVISALFPVVLVPVSIAMAGFNISLSLFSVVALLFSGVLQISWIGLYLKALQNDDVTVVMPLMSLSPLFAWLAGIVVLSEYPAAHELIGSGVILVSALVLGYHQRSGKLNYWLIATIGLASCLVAVTNALFKFGTNNETYYWAGLCWQSLGSYLVGAFVVILHKPSRDNLGDFLRKNAALSIGINLTNESFTLIGNALFGQALLLGRLMVVQSTEAFQPVFVFLLGTAVAFLFPQHMTEDLSKFALYQKTVGITGVCAGSFILFYN